MNVDAPAFVPKEASSSTSSPSAQKNDSHAGNQKKKQRNRKHKGDKPTNNPKQTMQRQFPPAHDFRHAHNARGMSGQRSIAADSDIHSQSTQYIVDGLSGMRLEDSFKGAGRKKERISVNHLTNFFLPPRQTHQLQRTPRRNKSASYQPFNKERFVNANFRFIVNPLNDYTANLADPDIIFDWHNIEQVLTIGEEMPICPICLCSPLAARVTKCGHVFCLTCIIRYMKMREEKSRQWRKCPICWDSIYERDLKSVRNRKPSAVMDHQVQRMSDGVKEGDEVELCLMLRPKNSTLAFPISKTWPIPEDVRKQFLKPDVALIPWYFTPNATKFARFMMTDPNYLEAEYHRDKMELSEALLEAESWGSTEEIPLIKDNIRRLEDSTLESQRLRTPDSDHLMHATRQIYDEMERQSKTEASLSSAASEASSNDDNRVEDGQDSAFSLSEPTLQNASRESSYLRPQLSCEDDNYYFFQAVDGQHIYLHPLDIRILKHEYGEYAEFPQQLLVNVTGVQESTLTEELRHQTKYMNHLPLACDVSFLETDLKSIVSKETFEVFSGQLKTRTKKREERLKREELEQKRADMKQKKQMRKQDTDARKGMENDPFFQINQPTITEKENADMLAQAIAASANEARETQNTPSNSGTRTVWGTPAITSQEEEINPIDWPEHIIVLEKKKNKKQKK